MTKLKILVTLTVAALVLLTPAIAWAQPAVMGVYGDATIDGVAAPDGSQVVAIIDGEQATTTPETVTTSGGAYSMNIVEGSGDAYEAKTVTFTVGGKATLEVTNWSAGLNKNLDLSGSSIPLEDAAITLSPSVGDGVFMVTGTNFVSGTDITIKWGAVNMDTSPALLAASPGRTFSAIVTPPAGTDAGEYTITASDTAGSSATATFTLKATSGVAGAAGPAGPAGAEGKAGAMGPRGPEGPRGVNGPSGPSGGQGVAGANGATGATGATGTTGATGQAASNTMLGFAFVVAILALVVAVIAMIVARKPRAAA